MTKDDMSLALWDHMRKMPLSATDQPNYLNRVFDALQNHPVRASTAKLACMKTAPHHWIDVVPVREAWLAVPKIGVVIRCVAFSRPVLTLPPADRQLCIMTFTDVLRETPFVPDGFSNIIDNIIEGCHVVCGVPRPPESETDPERN